MSAIQKNRRGNGPERSFHADVSLPSAAEGVLNPTKIKLSYVGANGASAQFRITAFGAGSRVETITLDGKGTDVNVEEVELSVSGSGRLVRIQPAFLDRGQSTPSHRLLFDVPVTIAVAGKSFEARELLLSLHRGMWPHTDLLDFLTTIDWLYPNGVTTSMRSSLNVWLV